MQTDATLLANSTQHYWAQHVSSVCMEPQTMLALVGTCCVQFETGQTLGPSKRTQHCWPKKPQQHATMLLRPFAQALGVYTTE